MNKLCLLFFLLPLALYGQSTYLPLKCVGEIPDDFRISSREKTKSDILNEIKNENKNNVSSIERTFFLTSNFLLNDLLLSGNIIYGDSLTVYINKVADQLLKNDSELRSKLRFYAIKSTNINAFATDPGMIFVTVGLLAELENEAQLAYVLSHEIIHYKNRHVINSYIREDEIANSGRKRTTDDKIRLISSYSKENELEADSLGYLLFCKSDYSQMEALKTIDLLQFSHLPLDEIPFTNSIYENELFKFGSEFHLDTINEINLFGDDYDDTYSSHPNIRKRKEQLKKQSILPKNGDTFAVGERYFNQIQFLARKELLYLFSINTNYMEGYYNAYVLSKKYPDNIYFKEMMVKFTYGLSKYKNQNKFYEVSLNYKKIEGESQQAYYFFSKLSSVELNSLAVVEAYNEVSKYPKNKFIKKLRDDLIEDLILEHDISINKINEAINNYKAILEKEKYEVKIDTSNSQIDTLDPQVLSKHEKLRLQKEKKLLELELIKNTKDYHLFAFANIINDTEFKNVFNRINDSINIVLENKLKQKEELAKMSYSKRTKYFEKQNKEKLNAAKIKSNKMVVVDPFYFESDNRKGLEVLNSEDGISTFSKNIETCGDAAKIDLEILSTQNMKNNETEKFNDISLLNNYYEEWKKHDSVELYCLQSEYITELITKYNTSYFNYSGLITLKSKKENKIYYFLIGVLSPGFLPFLTYYAFKPTYFTQYESVSFNFESHQAISNYQVQLNAPTNNSYIKSQIYNQLIKLKK